MISMGDLQDPKKNGTVPYFWQYFVGRFPSNRPNKYVGLLLMVGTSNPSDPDMAIDGMV